MPDQPVLAVDIDGVLNALGMEAPAPGWGDILVLRPDGGLFRLRFNPGHGQQLLGLAAETGAELIWCSRWEEMANNVMSRVLGLPPLPWVPMQASKAAALRAFVGDRPVCWVDDEPEPGAMDGHAAPWCVVVTDAAAGIQDEHFEQARSWLSEVVASDA